MLCLFTLCIFLGTKYKERPEGFSQDRGKQMVLIIVHSVDIGKDEGSSPLGNLLVLLQSSSNAELFRLFCSEPSKAYIVFWIRAYVCK